MKLAIISDIHDNLANLERFLEVFDGEGIICCGDVTTPETLEYLVERFVEPIKLVCGNMEIRQEEFIEVTKRHKNLEIFREIGEWRIEGSQKSRLALDLAFVHKPDRVEELAQTGKYQFVFYGHTHKPWISTVPEDSPSGAVQGLSSGTTTIIANPGTLGGVFTYSTFAILNTDTGQLELKKLY